MQLVIAPTPSGSPSVNPSAAPTPAATSASVGIPSPLPVDVVDDPGPDGVEITGLVFTILAFIVGALASVFSIVLAQRAVRIGQKAASEAEIANREASQARAAVAAERRRTFELEVLRDLAEALDERPHIVIEIAENPRRARLHFGNRLALLGEDDLPLWRHLDEYGPNELVDAVGPRTADDMTRLSRIGSVGGYRPSSGLIARLTKALRQDVLDAIEHRMVDRDE